jgi:hypothetical protein
MPDAGGKEKRHASWEGPGFESGGWIYLLLGIPADRIYSLT